MIRVVTRTFEEVPVAEFRNRVLEVAGYGQLPAPKFAHYEVVKARGSSGLSYYGVVTGFRPGHTKGREYVWRYDVTILQDCVPAAVSSYTYDEADMEKIPNEPAS